MTRSRATATASSRLGTNALALATLCVPAAAAQQDLPYTGEPIRYEASTGEDAVGRLLSDLASGETTLARDPKRGYLPALLAELGISHSSQMLVFSKTSFQSSLISPSRPRAVYFGDDAYVGWVPGAPLIEVTSIDPEQGPIFYVLEQAERETPAIVRSDSECMQCHASALTSHWPGNIVRSVHPDRTGMPLLRSGSFLTTPASPLEERWGGWYVTGTHGRQRHMGNALARESELDVIMDVESGANVTDLEEHFDTSGYLTPHSDIVALMVFEHQTEMHNVISRASYQARLAAHYQTLVNEATGAGDDEVSESTALTYARRADELVDRLLFRDEAQLEDRIAGTSSFAQEFSARGPRDSQGRSLFELELESRLLRYPCSYLIYSPAFERLPVPVLERVWKQLWDLLHGRDVGREFPHLSEEDRTAILEILLETKSDLPDYWR